MNTQQLESKVIEVFTEGSIHKWSIEDILNKSVTLTGLTILEVEEIICEYIRSLINEWSV